MTTITTAPPTLAYRMWSWLVTQIGHSMLLWSPPRITGDDIERLGDVAEPGDVVLRTMYRSLAIVIPGEYIHSGLVTDYGRVTHAVGKGVCEESLVGFMQIQDRVALFRPKYARFEAEQLAVEQAKALVGIPYDFFFERGEKRIYCHEFTMLCLAAGCTADMPASGYCTADTVLRTTGAVILDLPEKTPRRSASA